MRIRVNGSSDRRGWAMCRAIHFGGGDAAAALAVLCLGVALAASGCGGGGSGAPPPNPLFVSESVGNDGNTGTADLPLRTIARATQIASDNYTIVVAPGTYAEAVTTDRKGFATAQGLVFVADVTGEVARAFGGSGRSGTVTIDARAVAGEAFKVNNSAGVVIDGFTVIGGDGGGIVINKSSSAWIQNCIVSDTEGRNGDGIRVQSSSHATVFNNLVYRNANFGIAIVAGSPEAQLLHNTVVDNAGRGITIGNSDQGSPGAFLVHNVIQDNGAGAKGDSIKVFTSANPSRDSLAGFQSDRNLVFPANTYDPDSIVGRNDLLTTALFARNPPVAPDDFLLRCNNPPSCTSGSPALDAGGPLENAFRLCVQRWSATDPNGQNLDLGALDLGFHLTRTTRQPHCGVPVPEPKPKPSPTATRVPTPTPTLLP